MYRVTEDAPGLKEREEAIIQWGINSMFDKILQPRKYSVPTVYKKFRRCKNNAASPPIASLNSSEHCSGTELINSVSIQNDNDQVVVLDKLEVTNVDNLAQVENSTDHVAKIVDVEAADVINVGPKDDDIEGHPKESADIVDLDAASVTNVEPDDKDTGGSLKTAADFVELETHSTPEGDNDVFPSADRDSDCDSVASYASGICVSRQRQSHSWGPSTSGKRKSRNFKENQRNRQPTYGRRRPSSTENNKPHLRRSKRLKSAIHQTDPTKPPLQANSGNIQNNVNTSPERNDRRPSQENPKKRSSLDSSENSIGRRKAKKKRKHNNNSKVKMTKSTSSSQKKTNLVGENELVNVDVALVESFKSPVANFMDLETADVTNVGREHEDIERHLKESAIFVDLENASVLNVEHNEVFPGADGDSDCESVDSTVSGFGVSRGRRSHSQHTVRSTSANGKRKSRNSKENRRKRVTHPPTNGWCITSSTENNKPYLRCSKQPKSAGRQKAPTKPLLAKFRNIQHNVNDAPERKVRQQSQSNPKKRKRSDSSENGRKKAKKKCKHSDSSKVKKSRRRFPKSKKKSSGIEEKNIEDMCEENDISPGRETCQYGHIEDAWSKLSALEKNVSKINVNEMDKLMPFSDVLPGPNLCVSNKNSGNLISFQRYTSYGGVGSLFGPPRHIGGVWKSIVTEK